MAGVSNLPWCMQLYTVEWHVNVMMCALWQCVPWGDVLCISVHRLCYTGDTVFALSCISLQYTIVSNVANQWFKAGQLYVKRFKDLKLNYFIFLVCCLIILSTISYSVFFTPQLVDNGGRSIDIFLLKFKKKNKIEINKYSIISRSPAIKF